MFLTSIRRRDEGSDREGFPWTLPLVRSLDDLSFETPVTFLVGENGSGKSTVLEGLAAGMDAVSVGRRDIGRDDTLAAARAFAGGYRFVRRRHARTRLFMRAEDVFGFVNRVGSEIRGLADIEADLRSNLPEGSYGQRIATGMARGQRGALIARYGENPDGRSHGETFLGLLKQRLVPRGLYFLDEPEAPFSPARLLALIALMKDAVDQGSQFVVATHSPILMALRGARILLFDGDAVRPVAYDDVEHVRFTRAFLNDPQAYLRHL